VKEQACLEVREDALTICDVLVRRMVLVFEEEAVEFYRLLASRVTYWQHSSRWLCRALKMDYD